MAPVCVQRYTQSEDNVQVEGLRSRRRLNDTLTDIPLFCFFPVTNIQVYVVSVGQPYEVLRHMNPVVLTAGVFSDRYQHRCYYRSYQWCYVTVNGYTPPERPSPPSGLPSQDSDVLSTPYHLVSSPVGRGTHGSRTPRVRMTEDKTEEPRKSRTISHRPK